MSGSWILDGSEMRVFEPGVLPRGSGLRGGVEGSGRTNLCVSSAFPGLV